MREQAEKRLAELEAEQITFLEQANRQLAAYSAAIGELRKLLGLSPNGQPADSAPSPEGKEVAHAAHS